MNPLDLPGTDFLVLYGGLFVVVDRVVMAAADRSIDADRGIHHARQAGSPEHCARHAHGRSEMAFEIKSTHQEPFYDASIIWKLRGVATGTQVHHIGPRMRSSQTYAILRLGAVDCCGF